MTIAASMASVLVAAAIPSRSDEADALFDDSYVHEIRLTFADPNWYSTLYNAHDTDPNDPYFPARLEYESLVLDPVGVRFKGNSTFFGPSDKKSFKIDIDEYDESNPLLTFFGLKKLNLNNEIRDPTLLREKLFLDFAAAYVPTIRAVHTRVYVNDTYWGLYTAVEQVDKTFLRSRFGGSEDGNLFKGDVDNFVAGPWWDYLADLTWLGPDPSPYHDRYQLKTNETASDYSQLIGLIDVLNTVPIGSLPAQIEPILDVPTVLVGLALNNLFVNLDAYNGAAHNFYLYDRDDTGAFTHIHWDTNESFARFLWLVNPGIDPLELDPFWLPDPPHARPLVENLLAVPAYNRAYLRALARMLRDGFDVVEMEQRIDRLADLIRADVHADTKKSFTNAEFEQALYTNIPKGSGQVYGLRHFVEQRAAYLGPLLDSYAAPTDLRINEVMTSNTATIQDGAGDYDPWVEIHNLGPGSVDLQGLSLTDDVADPGRWVLPAGSLDDGGYLLLWLDGEIGEGPDHVSFSAQPAGGSLHLYDGAGGATQLIDSVAYPSLDPDRSLARVPDGDGAWATTDQPTPGGVNLPATPTLLLTINEFMAENDTTIPDPDGSGGFPDWIELHNAGQAHLDLGGMYLTDDLNDPTKWQIPAGLGIDAGGYLLFWADNDEVQGPTHTSFKLSRLGESIGLFGVDAGGHVPIDTLTFGPQSSDVSYGRQPDGSPSWMFFAPSSPGAPNLLCTDIDGDWICDDGDDSGDPDDHPCAGGVTQSCDDNCRYQPNTDQADAGGAADPVLNPGGLGPDGIGDVCQCGDLDADGIVGTADVSVLRAHFSNPDIAPLSPAAQEMCNVTAPVRPCDILDLTILRRQVEGAGQAPGVGQACARAGPALP